MIAAVNLADSLIVNRTQVRDVTGTLDGTMYVAVCRSLGPMESIPCPVGSAGCHVSDSGETKVRVQGWGPGVGAFGDFSSSSAWYQRLL